MNPYFWKSESILIHFHLLGMQVIPESLPIQTKKWLAKYSFTENKTNSI